MRNVRLWRGLLAVDQRTVIEEIEFEEFEEHDAEGDILVVARVRPRSGLSWRCGRCGRRAPWYDRGEGRRRWRGLDWGAVQVAFEAVPRVNCSEQPIHGKHHEKCPRYALGASRKNARETVDARQAWRVGCRCRLVPRSPRGSPRRM